MLANTARQAIPRGSEMNRKKRTYKPIKDMSMFKFGKRFPNEAVAMSYVEDFR